ncbi:hypothetical protein C8R43DRAFT_966268 [Mycena crocata]|nr:hypothetical protein C8R43DRAFT_966268 [Mycena crocata]
MDNAEPAPQPSLAFEFNGIVNNDIFAIVGPFVRLTADAKRNKKKLFAFLDSFPAGVKDSIREAVRERAASVGVKRPRASGVAPRKRRRVAGVAENAEGEQEEGGNADVVMEDAADDPDSVGADFLQVVSEQEESAIIERKVHLPPTASVIYPRKQFHRRDRQRSNEERNLYGVRQAPLHDEIEGNVRRRHSQQTAPYSLVPACQAQPPRPVAFAFESLAEDGDNLTKRARFRGSNKVYVVAIWDYDEKSNQLSLKGSTATAQQSKALSDPKRREGGVLSK